MNEQKAKRENKKSTLGSRKRRESLFIIADVLKAARAEAPKPKIMDEAKLSSRRLEAYLKLLLKAKLLETIKRNKKTLYKTTTKGEGYLSDFANLLKKLGLSVQN